MLDAIARERAPVARRRRLTLGGRRWSPRVLVPAGLAAVALIVVAIALTGGERAAAGAGLRGPAAARRRLGRARQRRAGQRLGRHLAQAGASRACRPTPTSVYEVECDGPKGTESAGTFRADAKGHAYVVLTTAARRGEYDAIRQSPR